MNSIHRFYFYLEYLVCRLAVCFIAILPPSFVEKLAEGTGSFLFLILRKRRKITLQNLEMALGAEKTKKELQAIGETSWQNLVKIAFEFVYLPKIAANPEKYIEGFINGHYFWDSLAQGKGSVYIISHFGNWEILNIAGKRAGLPLHTIARPMNNPFMHRYVKKLRTLAGTSVIDKSGAVKTTMKLLKKNQGVAMLIDQHNRHGVWVSFFGRQAATTSLPAILALRSDTPVLPVFIQRTQFGHAVAEVGAPFPLISEGDFEENVLANTQQYIARIEEEIRKRPTEWLWMHRRWREKSKS